MRVAELTAQVLSRLMNKERRRDDAITAAVMDRLSPRR